MNDVWVFIEQDAGKIIDLGIELLSKGRELAQRLNVGLSAIILGNNLEEESKKLFYYGADKVYLIEDSSLEIYSTLPYSRTMVALAKEYSPQIIIIGASALGRDLAPRISSALRCGLTADCTGLEIQDLNYKQKIYKDLLIQTRPAFGGNIIASIITPVARPQMATVREGVMKMETPDEKRKGELIRIPFKHDEKDSLVSIIERVKKESSNGLKSSDIIVAAGAGIGTKENVDYLKTVAHLLGGEIAASRGAVDKNYLSREYQVGQTGITVRPKLYIACGISGAIQHRAGMEHSSIIVAFNNDPNAPIFKIANYGVVGDIKKTIPMFIESYKKKFLH